MKSDVYIKEVPYNQSDIVDFSDNILEKGGELKTYLLDYPIVYIVHDLKNEEYSIYVGETTNIKRRTLEHLKSDTLTRDDWKIYKDSKTTRMYIIGNTYFNKSLTLDIENKLMMYLSSVDAVKKLNNRRTNEQNDYYTYEALGDTFSSIWNKLHQLNKKLFPLESVVQDSALFKASPFHKLTREQSDAKDNILLKIEEAVNRNKKGQLIFVAGEAGTGKTVLMSSLFYELFQSSLPDSDNPVLLGTKNYLLVNHEEQVKVYKGIGNKLGLLRENKKLVDKPTSFLNNVSIDKPVDVVLIDEAHLLWTQHKQAYNKKNGKRGNQLLDIIDRAKVVVAVFDKNQILNTEQYWEEKLLLPLIHESNLSGNYIELENQLRISAHPKTVNWIRHIIDKKEVLPIPKDDKYDLQIFSTPKELEQAIREKSTDTNFGLSRVLATFDWKFVQNKIQEEGKYWEVSVGEWSMPWNLQLPKDETFKKVNSNLAWAEQSQTIDEVGSTFTIQGFDLNYAGVIIGPSVKYRDNKIVFDGDASQNKKAKQKRTLSDNTKERFTDQFIQNELNVLLTRGVHGLYIYAVDEGLQQALKNAMEYK